MKVTIYSPNYNEAARLAAFMSLRLSQWDWAACDYTWANVEPLFERIADLENQISSRRQGW